MAFLPERILPVGRQFVYGADIAALDGVSFTVDRHDYAVTVFGGRRFTYYSDPEQRAIGGANVVFRLAHETTFEYSGLWYVRGENSLTVRKRFSQPVAGQHVFPGLWRRSGGLQRKGYLCHATVRLRCG